MRIREIAVPLTLLGGIAAFVAVQGVRMRTQPRSSAVTAEAGASDVQPQGVLSPGAEPATTAGDGAARVEHTTEAAPDRDTAAIAAMIREGSPGTYLLEMLERQDHALYRWPSRMSAVRVWIDRDRPTANWDPSYPVVAERAFAEWQEAGFPLRFDVVRDSATAEIRIHWIDQFSAELGDQIGLAQTARDQHGWLRRTEITIATRDRAGRALPSVVVAGAARHEVGHALGLGHSSSAADVMHPESKSTVISTADRRTLHLLYLLPPGSVR